MAAIEWHSKEEEEGEELLLEVPVEAKQEEPTTMSEPFQDESPSSCLEDPTVVFEAARVEPTAVSEAVKDNVEANEATPPCFH